MPDTASQLIGFTKDSNVSEFRKIIKSNILPSICDGEKHVYDLRAIQYCGGQLQFFIVYEPEPGQQKRDFYYIDDGTGFVSFGDVNLPDIEVEDGIYIAESHRLMLSFSRDPGIHHIDLYEMDDIDIGAPVFDWFVEGF
jgi:hypothetical protein